ncbi:MAG: GTP-binding protein [Promethearchaeota archaeon]|nr:MAG: GTP-binding protein [Candidatus Lokiarchaeota archaeon]
MDTINLKLVVLGEGEVGKTSIINAFLRKEIPMQYLPTIGSITTKKEYVIKENQNEVRIILSIWDAGGQRSFNPLNPAIYADLDIVLLVFDLSRPKETLKNLKSEFLENANRYSEEILSILVGNKLDLLSVNDEVKETIKSFLTKNDNLIFISAKTSENITECIELLIYTFLRKAEILYPDVVLTNISQLFLKLINKNEKQLKSRLINLKNIDKVFQKVEPKLKVKKATDIEKKDKDLVYYDFLKQELNNNDIQKNEVMDRFLINLTELNKTIQHIKKSQSTSVEESFIDLKDFLMNAKKEFEMNLELMTKLNREEFELVKIITKFREEHSKLEIGAF